MPVVAVPVTAVEAHWQPAVAGQAAVEPMVAAVAVAVADPDTVVVADRVVAGTAVVDTAAVDIPVAADNLRVAWVAPGTAAGTSAAGIAADT